MTIAPAKLGEDAEREISHVFSASFARGWKAQWKDGEPVIEVFSKEPVAVSFREGAVSAPQLDLLPGAISSGLEMMQLDGPGQEVLRPRPHRIDGRGDIAVARALQRRRR